MLIGRWAHDIMAILTINLSPTAYEQLQKRARAVGKPPEVLSRELLEEALQIELPAEPSARDLLQAAGLLRPLSPTLRSKITPGVTLEEVRAILGKAGGPSLSEIILDQRGPKK
jgi:hypothetical protein